MHEQINLKVAFVDKKIKRPVKVKWNIMWLKNSLLLVKKVDKNNADYGG